MFNPVTKMMFIAPIVVFVGDPANINHLFRLPHLGN
jgi:hypothetical protein